MDVPGESLRDVAIKLAADQVSNDNVTSGPRERSLFILGSKGCGKSTLYNLILERQESPKPTIALKYSFGRRTSYGQSYRRQVCHLWELGGTLTNTSNLVAVPIGAHDIHSLTVIVMLDLSQPNKLWSDLEAAITCLNIISSNEKIMSLKMGARNRIGLDHVDMNTINVFPIPLLFIGGKYDIFQDLDPEIKKWVSRSLRGAAHYFGASLMYYSNSEAGLQKKARDLLNHHGFGNPPTLKGSCQDYNKPLLIPFGGDSWENIDLTPTSFDKLTIMYTSQIPQQSRVAALPDDPSADTSFREPLIDSMRNQKDEELQRFIEENERQKRYGIIDIFDMKIK